MSMNNQGRPSQPGTAQDNDLPTISGDRGLDLEARLIFEIGRGGVGRARGQQRHPIDPSGDARGLRLLQAFSSRAVIRYAKAPGS